MKCDPSIVRCSVPNSGRGKYKICRMCSLAREVFDGEGESFEYELNIGETIPTLFKQIDIWQQDEQELSWPEGAPGDDADGW